MMRKADCTASAMIAAWRFPAVTGKVASVAIGDGGARGDRGPLRRPRGGRQSSSEEEAEQWLKLRTPSVFRRRRPARVHGSECAEDRLQGSCR